jgi:hypothetical protein
MIPREACSGCRDDFYNVPGNAIDGKRCWSAKSGKIITRYATGVWTAPTEPGAFQQVTKPSCYNRDGTHYVNALPSFVKVEDVIGYSRAKKRRKVGGQ